MNVYKPLPSIRIGANEIPVVVNEHITHFGQFVSMPTRRIEVGKEGHDQIAATLLHEALHAIDAAYHIKLGENRVGVLETVLHSLIRDNPKLVRMLQE